MARVESGTGLATACDGHDVAHRQGFVTPCDALGMEGGSTGPHRDAFCGAAPAFWHLLNLQQTRDQVGLPHRGMSWWSGAGGATFEPGDLSESNELCGRCWCTDLTCLMVFNCVSLGWLAALDLSCCRP